MSTIVPLVGAHFRKPAPAILGVLPLGHPLILEPEPTNPYDPNAIKVNISIDSIRQLPQEVQNELDVRAAGSGHSLEEILNHPEDFHLGFVAKEETEKLHPILNSCKASLVMRTDLKRPYGVKVEVVKAETPEVEA